MRSLSSNLYFIKESNSQSKSREDDRHEGQAHNVLAQNCYFNTVDFFPEQQKKTGVDDTAHL